MKLDQTPQAPASLVLPMRSVLRGSGIFTLVAVPVGAGLGYLFAGWPGVWGALIGIAVPLVFFTLTIVVALATARMHPSQLGFAVMATWLAKLVGLIAALAVLRGMDFYSRGAFAAALIVATIAYLVMEALIVLRTKVLYVETEFAPEQG
jgi:hypothetical protein